MVTLEQISTNVLKAPIRSSKWTSIGVGQAGEPNRSTMYVPMRPGEKHDFRRKEEPHAELSVRQRQCGLILQMECRVRGYRRDHCRVPWRFLPSFQIMGFLRKQCLPTCQMSARFSRVTRIS